MPNTNLPKLIVYWSRRDFRLTDNPALSKAIDKSQTQKIPLLPIFIIEKYMSAGDPKYQFGYPSQYLLSQALPLFRANFDNFTIFEGAITNVFKVLSKDFDVEIFVNEDVHPDFYKQVLKLQNINYNVNIFNDQLTINKNTVSGTGNMYTVFSPFKKNIWKQFLDYPEVQISSPKLSHKLETQQIDIINKIKYILPVSNDNKLIDTVFTKPRRLQIKNFEIKLDDISAKPDLSEWYWSEAEATKIFDTYLKSDLLSDYKQNRDSLELDTINTYYNGITIHGKTSKMSLGLAWGMISPRTLKNKIIDYYKQDFSDFGSTTSNQGVLCFLSELIWREFYKYIFYHRPQVLNTEFQEKYQGTINWVEDDLAKQRFLAWIKGETGYPAVDAAMNQLSSTGWMHNRARMMVASILTKNLGVDWRWGQEYFRAALIDLDEASNNGGWQWGSSTGSDPKPIRIFNPYLQAENYDKNNIYQNKWLPKSYIANPLVEHKVARRQAMKRYGLNERGAN